MTDSVVRGLQEAITENHRLFQSLQRAEEDLGKEIGQIEVELKDASHRIVILNNDFDSLLSDLTLTSNDMKATESSLQHLIFTSKKMDVSLEDAQSELIHHQQELASIEHDVVEESRDFQEKVTKMETGLADTLTLLQDSEELQSVVFEAMITDDEGQ